MRKSTTRAALLLFLPLASLTLACVSPAPRPVTTRRTGTGAPSPTPTPSPTSAPVRAQEVVNDPHSFARPHEVRTTHLDLDLRIDFEEKVLSGIVDLTLQRTKPDAPLVLDMRALLLGTVWAGPNVTSLRIVRARTVPGDALRGDALEVPLGPDDALVRISYRTTREGSGLLWLDPAQTAGKRFPYVFSQSQAIHSRTWIPCQDTPSVRVTFDATFRVAEPHRVVMGAEMEPSAGSVFKFHMRERVPSYLIAFAAGDLAFAPIGGRAGVYTEPALIEAAASEFKDAEKMMTTVEALYGPYRWGRFDILVLPPSFPAGGMENPRLTFVSPTLLAGDRSLVSTICHELAHSWSGNLVTNATWNDLWLNEGFTSYIEQRVIEELYGRDRSVMETMLDMDGLTKELLTLPKKDQRLTLDLAGRDPDDGFTGVPYQKGAAFLRLLEATFGRAELDVFLRSYFDAHAFQSMTTPRFAAYLRANLFAKAPKKAAKIKLDRWLNGPGLPPDTPRTRSEALSRVETLVAGWKSGSLAARSIETGAFTSHEWLHFVRTLGDVVEPARLAELDEIFSLTKTGNAEIASAWLSLAIRSGYAAADARVESFLLEVGRPKLIKPLYQAFARTVEGRKRGHALLDRARPGYHAIAVRDVEQILNAPVG